MTCAVANEYNIIMKGVETHSAKIIAFKHLI